MSKLLNGIHRVKAILFKMPLTFFFFYNRARKNNPKIHRKKVKVSVAQLCLCPCDPVDCSLPGSSVHGISQARILEWVAIPFSRESSWPRDWTQVFCIAGRLFTIWATRRALKIHMEPPKNPFTKSFLRKNSKTGSIVSSDFKLFYKATVIKTAWYVVFHTHDFLLL